MASYEDIRNKRETLQRTARDLNFSLNQIDRGLPVSRMAMGTFSSPMRSKEARYQTMLRQYELLENQYKSLAQRPETKAQAEALQPQILELRSEIARLSPDINIGGYPQGKLKIAPVEAMEKKILGAPAIDQTFDPDDGIEKTHDWDPEQRMWIPKPETRQKELGTTTVAAPAVSYSADRETFGGPVTSGMYGGMVDQSLEEPLEKPRSEIEANSARPADGVLSAETMLLPQQEEKQNFGVSGTRFEDLSEGALAALGGASNLGYAMEIAKALQPEYKGIDPALLAFQFFTNMAAEASKPGATALGAASTASLEPAKYLMEDYKRKRDAEDDLIANTLKVAQFIKPEKGTGVGQNFTKIGPVTNEDGTLVRNTEGAVMFRYQVTDNAGNPIGVVDQPDPGTIEKPDTTIKTVGSGTLAKYMTREDAIEFVKGQGMSESNPNFQRNVEMLTAPSDEMVGAAITDAGVFLEIVPLAKGGEVINLQLTPSKTAAAPHYETYVAKRIPELAEAATTYHTSAREVLPRVNEALMLLKSGKVQTGRLQQALLPFKQTFNQLFGINDPSIMGLESLQATSNYLAPKMRPAGSGSTSDMEFRAYQQAALYIGNTPQANYISLYAFKKMAENGIRLHQLETEMLTSNRYNDMEVVNEKLNALDPGIFEKYRGDPNDQEAVQKWYDSLPDGAVIVNNDIFDTDDIYIIKGWGE